MYRIFMIEDDEVVAEIYKRKIEAEGYAVEVAFDGESGCEKLAAYKPDLLLLDMFLPKRPGVEVLDLLRADDRFKDLPILAFSGGDETLVEAKRRGATGVLSKGELSPTQVVARITELLAASRPADHSKDFVITSIADWGAAPSRVLVVDDDPVILTLVKGIIEEEGYAVVTAPNGREALKILQRRADFVAGIFDVKIPGLEGPEIVRYMQTEKRLMRIPILIMSGEQSLSLQAESFSAGAKLFVPKPFTRAMLRTMFRTLLAQSASAN